MDLKHPTTITPPPHSQSIKLLTFPNGNSHHHHHHIPTLSPPSTRTAAIYKECLKNHAVAVGGHAVDGCGEFMPVPTYSSSEPSSLKCAACGCHRNFHRREPTTVTAATTSVSLSPTSPPLEPKNYAYGQLVLSLGPTASPATPATMKFNEKKRFRSKFSSDQKQKMLNFAEKLGWKMQRCDDKMVADFCNEIGIRRRIFKVWMHNNKNTLAKRDKHTTIAGTTAGATTTSNAAVASGSLDQENGSSSSSQNR
ncbi:hypothetical protein QVD17_18371 [Tagetes erecta]|uniref:ZF-HD dimerization-type domain-containing protein n=1 Tax=Tagetes erecta TaxID=13708 RepID=A0AAD8NW04_TARER|nr:hypothetical protein QVD17_18371 [Tagetes erecta]